MNILTLFRKNKEKFFFISILLLGSFLRFYRLPETMQFLGDQGRDALIARRILMDKRPAFIGPVTSVGNMYLGPFYYYFMVFPLLLTYPSPIGPAYAVAAVGILTLAAIYVLGKQMIGKTGAGIAMLLYAVSPVVIANVRFSWNPNIVPFFSLIAVWAVWKTWNREYSYWLLAGVCSALLFQLHYIALILIGCIGLVWLLELVRQVREKKINENFVRYTLYALGFFALSLVPILIFDTRHGWLNTRAFFSFFHPTVASESHFRRLNDPSGILVSLVSMTARVVSQFFAIVAVTFAQKILIVIFFFYMLLRTFFHTESPKKKNASLILLGFFILSITLLSMYSSSVFDHYLGFTFPIVFLLFGMVLASFWRSIFFKPLVLIILAAVMISSLRNYPGTLVYGSTVHLFDRSSQEISKHIPQGTSFNLLSYSPTKDLQAMNYRYFLTAYGKPPADPDDWLSFKRLYIIDEEHRESPFDESQYVINIWPNRVIVDHFSIPDGPDVYVLER